MQSPAASVRIHGTAEAVARARTACEAAGFAFAEEAPDVELVADGPLPASSQPVVRLGGNPRAFEELAAGKVVDVIAWEASPEELAARVARAHRVGSASADAHRVELGEQLALIRDLATSEDLPALLLRIVRHLADAAGVERCSLVRVEGMDATRGLVIASSDRAGVQQLVINLADYPEILEARRTGLPVVVTDAAHNPLLGHVRHRLERAGVGAVACFPLHAEGRFLGVLMMRSRTPLKSVNALGLASVAASATAIAVRHARLVEEAREAAAREMARYEAFISQLSDGVAVLDSGLEVLLLNPAGAELLQVIGDCRGAKFFELAKPADVVAAQLLGRELARGARVRSADLDVELPDGRRVVFEVSAGPLRGDVEGRAILSFRDVTEQREKDAELRRTRDFQERLIDASADAIVAADLEGHLLVFNRAAEQLFGVGSADARVQLTSRDLYPDGGAQAVMRMLRQSPQGRIEGVRCYVRTRSGEEVPIELSAAVVHADGREEATVGLMRDLRERVRVESELARTRAQLVEAEKQRAVTALAGATAHELNQPLTVIIGYVDLLRRRILDEAHRRPLDAIGAEAERMAQIVRKIAKLTRIETMAYPGEKEIADLDRSVQAGEGKPVVRR